MARKAGDVYKADCPTRQVLDRMKELESYNEAVALLRGIISEQEEINRRTRDRQKERLQNLLDE